MKRNCLTRNWKNVVTNMTSAMMNVVLTRISVIYILKSAFIGCV